jgi:hypothetical protein
MGNDQLFKELLQRFLSDFVELFFPEVHKRLNFSKVTFLDKEVFTGFPRRRATPPRPRGADRDPVGRVGTPSPSH